MHVATTASYTLKKTHITYMHIQITDLIESCTKCTAGVPACPECEAHSRSKTAPRYSLPFPITFVALFFLTTKPHRALRSLRTHFPPACTHVRFFELFRARHTHAEKSICSPSTS